MSVEALGKLCVQNDNTELSLSEFVSLLQERASKPEFRRQELEAQRYRDKLALLSKWKERFANCKYDFYV